MKLFPVILCGGGGTRLWPASTQARPKPFIPWPGRGSLFQQTALRVAGASDDVSLVVVASGVHADLIQAQLREVGLSAVLLLEPTPRDSGPAIAAAAAWIADQDPEGLALVLASDHDVPDAAAFQDAVRRASAPASQGRIVTFGVVPRAASTAYGYIKPGPARGEVFDLAAFVEKPGPDLARTYVDAGYLWNSGNFVASAATLLAAFDLYAPEVAQAARSAVASAKGPAGRLTLGETFADAPRISFDYAVMERTDRAVVLPVDFAWSDLGAWSAVREVMVRDDEGNARSGDSLTVRATGCLIRTDGPAVAVIGVENLAVVAENGSVLVCALGSDQSVNMAHAHFLAASRPAPAIDLSAAADSALTQLDLWLRNAALPLWWSMGANHDGAGFLEALTPTAASAAGYRRLRVQARQTFVYARAGRYGWPGPWRTAVAHGLAAIEARYRREDGLYRRMVDADGVCLDDSAQLYDQAFVLLAFAEAARVGVQRAPVVARGEALRGALDAFRWSAGGFREATEQPFQANCHMHLFEACLAWLEVEGLDPAPWRALCAEIVELATRHFVRGNRGVLHEFFDSAWNTTPSSSGACFEPGHQFEWAWLFDRWNRLGGGVADSLVTGLYENGRAGLQGDAAGVVNRMSAAFQVLDSSARLWPQTEYLRAAVMMRARSGDDPFAAHIVEAASSVRRYLETPTPGLWWDVRGPDGGFDETVSPASSLYHLVGLLRPAAAAA